MIELASVTFGADPEAFLTRNGVVIGSEKILPPNSTNSTYGDKVMRDGVQIELHPTARSYPSGTTQGLGNVFSKLRSIISQVPDVKVCLKPVVEVSEEELSSLSDESKMLGCMPSQNIYGFKSPDVDGKIFKIRSAGGHIHLGLENTRVYDPSNMIDFRLRLVPIFDIIVGNTCVLIDNDPSQRVRRKLYGRPGEYRTPSYGLEYRTLSNFWLRSPALAEFVFGMSNIVVGILNTSLAGGEDLEGELIAPMDWRRVVRAIYLNDTKVARENWKWVGGFLVKHASPESSPIHAGNVEKFDKFLEVVEKAGLGVFFPEDGDEVMDQWTGVQSAGAWDTFISSIQA